ncbi:MAG: beta-lactamase family protein [Defluviitaleaceae bacterium]|nr:beta-lactamase family protein [Defluviitaleaceae bacterium]
MEKIIQNKFDEWMADGGEGFSGVFSVSDPDGVVHIQAYGHRNKAEELPNTPNTAFSIASGTKLFTGLAVCKLIDSGKLGLDDKLHDILSGKDLGQIDKGVTIHQLLSHTSGVGDYIDEDAEDMMADLEALYAKYPCYLWTNLDYYLQMTAPLPPKFAPGGRYSYSNSGYVLLGLVVEAISKMPYQQYVQENIISPCGLERTGFYCMDNLPPNTALGYMEDEGSGQWRTNIFSLPIMGGSDGGIFTCAADMDKLWRAIFTNKILSKTMTQTFLSQHSVIDEEDGETYGLGVYRVESEGKMLYYAMGIDNGVSFVTAYFLNSGIVTSVLCNAYVWCRSLVEELFEVL